MSKFFKQFVFLLLPASLALRAFGQGTFQNLDFESATIPPGTAASSVIPASNAIPEWTATLTETSPPYTTSPSPVYYDGISTGGPFVSITDLNGPNVRGTQAPLQGNYSVYLFGGGAGPEGSTTISQSGLVPDGTRSLTMDMYYLLATPVVTLGGQTIDMVPLMTFPTYTVYGGDISSFSGQNEQLAITEPPPPPTQSPPSFLLLDDIQFSDNPVPEPSTYALLVCGVVAFGFNHWRRKT